MKGKRILLLTAALFLLLSFASCVTKHAAGEPSPENDGIEMPEDFSFSIVWDCYGISSYDSATGKLVKTNDTKNLAKYTKYPTTS